MVKEVASKTADVAGDGTTTATVLAQALITEGMRNVASGANPMDLKRGMDKASSAIVAELQKMSKEVGSDNSKIEQVATISANNDNNIGSLIAEAMETVGNEGVITVEEAKGMGGHTPHILEKAFSWHINFKNCHFGPDLGLQDGAKS